MEQTYEVVYRTVCFCTSCCRQHPTLSTFAPCALVLPKTKAPGRRPRAGRKQKMERTERSSIQPSLVCARHALCLPTRRRPRPGHLIYLPVEPNHLFKSCQIKQRAQRRTHPRRASSASSATFGAATGTPQKESTRRRSGKIDKNLCAEGDHLLGLGFRGNGLWMEWMAAAMQDPAEPKR
jgi:hypothetical protein